MSKSKKLVVVLGCNGALGSGLLAKIDIKGDLVGIDQQDRASSVVRGRYLKCDLLKVDDIHLVMDQLSSLDFDEVILVSCVGAFGQATFGGESLDEGRFMESIQVNLLGVSLFCLHLSHLCIKKKVGARVVVVGSAASYVGSRDIGYGISKARLNGLVISLSKSLSSQHIIVIGVNPGIFESPMSRSVSKERQEKAIESTHIGRIGMLDEICNTVLYAAFSAPDYLTGSIISINGGQVT